jgi:hypothetical protein
MQRLNLLLPDSTIKVVEYPKDYVGKLDVVYTKVKDWEGKRRSLLQSQSRKTYTGVF